MRAKPIYQRRAQKPLLRAPSMGGAAAHQGLVKSKRPRAAKLLGLRSETRQQMGKITTGLSHGSLDNPQQKSLGNLGKEL